VEERRAAPVPGFEEVREPLRQRMMEEQLDAAVNRFRAAATIERPDRGSGGGAGGPSPLDSAVPPPPPAAPRR
jgi:peptidyl-prolyl cis-trans isomerase C